MEISTSIDIERPAGDVFAFVADVRNNPAWQRGQRSCTWTSEPPVGVGSSYDQHARFLGKDVVTSFEVVEHDPPHRIAWRSTAGSFPLRITRTVDPRGAVRSRFTEHVDGDPQGFFRVAEPVLRPLARRAIRRDFRRLKAALEGAGAHDASAAELPRIS